MKKLNPYKIIFDLFLLLFSFSITFFIKSGNFNFDKRYMSFLPLLILGWLLAGIFTSKFRDSEEGRLEPYAFSALYFTGFTSLLIYGLQMYNLSRFVIFGGISIYLLLEIFFISGLILP
ncbi:MAG: hypothetical protein KAS21_08130, partial [Candidatus Aminicenantes bacterium]|nr:hypothetical protein [Candidatus Aminicenantes bacterium]